METVIKNLQGHKKMLERNLALFNRNKDDRGATGEWSREYIPKYEQDIKDVERAIEILSNTKIVVSDLHGEQKRVVEWEAEFDPDKNK